MAKNKTSVILPGGIQNLVNDLQNGKSQYQPQSQVDPQAAAVAAEEEPVGDDKQEQLQEAALKQYAVEDDTEKQVKGAEEPEPAKTPSRGRKPKEEAKSYNIIRDDSVGSWDLFVDMAKQYKTSGAKLATIYIDPQLKAVLDRLKYIGPEKFPTSAILSSIVARFIYDHEEDIRKLIFNQRLL